MPRYNAVNVSANQNLSNSFMESELNILHGERRGMVLGIHVIHHNTNNTKTGERPWYMPSGLAFFTDMYHRNNSKDSNQATMNNMSMERGRMLKEPDNQSSGKAAAMIDSKTSAAALHSYRAMKTPMIMILIHHIIFPSSRTVLCHSTPFSPMLVHGVHPLPWRTMTICCRPA